jgi:hypothetical protein
MGPSPVVRKLGSVAMKGHLSDFKFKQIEIGPGDVYV